MNTLERLKGWLANEGMLTLPMLKIRPYFRTTNGINISIQMSSKHHCKVDESVEMWNCPPSPLLMAFGDGQDPYAYVPLDVVAGYIDSLESLGENHDYN
jgi:hypothetical protein